MPKVKVKVSFRYDAEGIVDAPKSYAKDFLKEVARVEKELNKELDFMFGAAGTVSDFKASCQEVNEDE